MDAPLDRPIPPTWRVRDGRDAYLRENGFTLAGYDEPRSKITILGVSFWLPNPPSRRRAIMRHDLHHVATGYGTDMIGEAEISAWELRRGLAGLGLYVRALVVGLAALGLVIAPFRTLRAWRASTKGTPSLFAGHDDYDALLELDVGELRSRLGAPREGVATRPRRRHAAAPIRPV